jgi:hypothetical protein
LDQTALRPELAKYQGIDMRGIIGPHEGMVERSIAGVSPGPTKTEREWGVIVPEKWVLFQAAIRLRQTLAGMLGENE